MQIAVTSQNRKTITGHAGKCRKFWIFDIEGKQITARNLLELPIEQSFHESSHEQPHPLDDVNVLICGGMGQGMQNRLKQKNILAVATSESDPETAVAAWLAGSLVEIDPEAHDHDHDHGKTVQIMTLSANTLIQPHLED
jgi:predicted Fe-Mo cluster-binding NifX family protein